MTLWRRRTIRLEVLSSWKTDAYFSATERKRLRSPTRTAWVRWKYGLHALRKEKGGMR